MDGVSGDRGFGPVEGRQRPAVPDTGPPGPFERTGFLSDRADAFPDPPDPPADGYAGPDGVVVGSGGSTVQGRARVPYPGQVEAGAPAGLPHPSSTVYGDALAVPPDAGRAAVPAVPPNGTGSPPWAGFPDPTVPGHGAPVNGAATAPHGVPLTPVAGPAESGWQATAEPADDGPRPGRSRHRSSRRRRPLPMWQEVPLLLLAAFCIAVLIRTFLLQAFYIPSGSMEHTLDVGDKVLVNKVVYDVRDPARGEIVVFRGTDRWAPEHKPPPTNLAGKVGRTLGDLVGLSQPGEKDFIKRVIGLPGDIVACCDAQGRVTVNGHALDEPYIFENSPDDVPASATECRSREFDPVTVPEGHVYVMGDHRLVSQDSRCQGPVPIENVIGRAFLVVWPADRWHTLDVPDGFAGVPKPYAAFESEGAPAAPAAPAVPAGGLVLPLLVSLARPAPLRVPRPRTLSG